MAALLVAMSVMAVMMSVVMPVWKQTAQREKEAELVFRGQQYTRAIRLFQQKAGPTFPPSLDVLVEQRALRRKYKDPITNDNFLLIPAAVPAGTQQQAVATQNSLQSLNSSTQSSSSSLTSRSGSSASPYVKQDAMGTTVPGGIAGVVSSSPDESIMVLNGRTHYNEWEFRFVAPAAQQGGQGGAGGRGGPPAGAPPDGRGGTRGVGPGGRGQRTGPDGRPNDFPPGGRQNGPGGLPAGRGFGAGPNGPGGVSGPSGGAAPPRGR
ncbi:MAG TPA: hypothetical protein VJP86_05780 [Vicinamibacterales bacterium]|jgi:type II secretory pathway pseudopilin PulG|nr:hypothetical protein [Vicinamibacterales bacterium]